MIQITLGLDLTENKTETIMSHNVYLFVSDEIYYNRDYLQQLKKVLPVSKLTLGTLDNLNN